MTPAGGPLAVLWRVLLVLAGVASCGLLAAPASASPAADGPVSDRVVVIGVAGLRWDDLSPSATPALWQLAAHGAVGTLTARSTQPLTCTDDGWLTLGAGNRAQRGPHRAMADGCPGTAVRIAQHQDGSATLPDQPQVVTRNAPSRSRPGALAESLRCTSAVGPGAAIALARPVGRINEYATTLPADPTRLLARCPLSVVDAGAVSAASARGRAAQAAAVDAVVARVLRARPVNSTVLVVGVAETSAPARLHVAIADGPRFEGGWLRSSTTGRTGYVQLSDVAPTVTSALGLRRPAPFAGQPWRDVGTRDGASMAAVRGQLVDTDDLAVATARNAGWFVAVLVTAQLALYVFASFALVRLHRVGLPGAAVPPVWLRPALEIAASACALLVPAMLLAGLLPWWRAGRPGWALTGVLVVGLAALTTLVQVGPWRRLRFGRVAATAGVVAAVIGVDAVTGAHLELDNVVGYTVVTGDRYTGLGMIGLGAFTAGILALAGCAAIRLRRRWRPVAIGLVGAIGVLVVGSPFFGADPGAAIGLTAGAAVAGALATGGWLTLTRLGWAIVAGVVVTGGFTLLDLTRAPDQRGHLGRFVGNLFGGTARPALSRVAEANMVATATSLLTVLVVAVGLFWGLVLSRPDGGLRRVYGLFPAVRGALVGTAVAGVVAGLFDGAGLIVVGSAAAVAVPLALLFCVQVRPDTAAMLAVAAPDGPAGRVAIRRADSN